MEALLGGKKGKVDGWAETIDSTTECQGFVQKRLKYNLFEGKYCLAPEGKSYCA